MKVTDESFWRSYWGGNLLMQQLIMTKDNCELHPIFSRYLPQSTKSHQIDFVEIGCYPGRILFYFAKEFSYRVSGIDFLTEAATIPGILSKIGVEAQVEVANLFTLRNKKQYDVVLSAGFVEHFSNWQEVLQRHLDLLKAGGTLVITMPNFRYGQYWLRWLIDPNFADGHCLEVMDPQIWRNALKGKGLEVLYCGYFLPFGIWMDASSRNVKSRDKFGRGVFLWANSANKLISRLNLDLPNKYFSPHIVIIAKSPKNLA
jgi:SAM-dependent methyltransferase